MAANVVAYWCGLVTLLVCGAHPDETLCQKSGIVLARHGPTPASTDLPESSRFTYADALERHSDLSDTSGARLSFSVGPPLLNAL
jgi:hypothetical protein